MTQSSDQSSPATPSSITTAKACATAPGQAGA